MSRPSLILFGGRVVTLDPALRVTEAVAIAGDRIAEVGAGADVRRLAGADTRLVDLQGRVVVPGLVDAHAHMDREGLKSLYPSLAGARSIDDVLQRVEVLVKAAAPGDWIVTMPLGDPPYYFDVPGNLREKRYPTRRDLDRVAPRNPVYIRSIWGYWRHTLPLVSIANSEALRLAGITRETVPPWDGIEIARDSTGEPTGIFVEQTYIPVVELSLMAAAPRFTHEDRGRGLRESMRIYNAAGTTSVVEGHGVADEVLRVYDEAAARGELTVRAHLTLSPSWGAANAMTIEARLAAWKPRIAGRGGGDAFLRVAGLVAETNPSPDGDVRARAMPYTGWAGFSYDAALPREQLRAVLLAAAREDIRILSMGTGLLDLYEDVNRAVPIRDRRWVIEHIGVLTADEIGRIRDLGVVLTTHTNRYLYKEGDAFRVQLGPLAEDTIVPLRRLKEAGVHVALATDNVPPSLFWPVWQAVARAGRATSHVIAPAQRLSRADALRAATIEGAYLTFEEDQKGSIEPGKLADLVVLSDDPMTCAEIRIRDITAEMTIVGGRIVHDSGWAAA
jgi:predicted amidohydrolase YtcJ